MATNAEVLDLAMSRLGQRSSTRIRADVLSEVNASINTLEKAPFLPWFLRATDSFAFGDFTVSNAIGTTALDSTFLRDVEDTRVYYTTSEAGFNFLTKLLIGMLPTETPLGQSFYAIDVGAKTISVRIAPVTGQTYWLEYYAEQTGNLVDDATAVSNKWLLNAQDYILAHALKTVARFQIQNDELAAKFAIQQTEEYTKLYNYHESLAHENQDYFVGGASPDGS